MIGGFEDGGPPGALEGTPEVLAGAITVRESYADGASEHVVDVLEDACSTVETRR